MNLTSIYVHLEPDIDEIRYVGKADDPKERLYQHLWRADKNSYHHANWLKALKARGLKPRLEVLCEVPVEEWEFWEKHYIKYFRECGFDLTNATPGGEGGPTLTGRKLSLAHCAAISNGLTGKSKTAEHVEKMAAHKRGKPLSEEHCKALSVAHQGEKNGFYNKKHSEETRQLLSNLKTGVKMPSEFGAAIAARQTGKTRGPVSPEALDNMRRAQRARQARERDTHE